MLSQILLAMAGLLLVGFLASLVWISILVAAGNMEIPVHKHNDDFGGDYDDYERQLTKPR